MISFLIKDLKSHATQAETLASECKPVKRVSERDFWMTFERRCWSFGLNATESQFSV